jgi:branched-chain amino acid aminotransferase
VTTDPSKWGVTSVQLQRPENIYFGGKVRPWGEATIHASSEAVVRGLNVFEGIKGYWQEDGGFGLRLLRRHYERMRRSARLLHMPVDFSFEQFEQACFDITQAEVREGKDLYIRATLFMLEGHYGEGDVTELALFAYQQPLESPRPITAGTSTWRRGSDAVMPARIKSGSNYQIARLARIEGRSRGYADMIVLNPAGRVAEGVSAALLMVRDGTVYTPPPWEGALESITVDVLEQLASALGIGFVRRPVERSELYLADEVAITGTLTEIQLITALDDNELPEEKPVLSALLERYRAAVRGAEPHPAIELSLLPS